VAPIRVLVCDDADAFRLLLRYTLTEEPGIEVIGEAADGGAAVSAAADLGPDVVLLDLTMPLMDGFEAIPAILAAAPKAQVIALSGWEPDRMAAPALAAGAVAYVQKTDDVQALRDAIRAAAGR
jgi:DNA-binding NarL/FixJ family response regulator